MKKSLLLVLLTLTYLSAVQAQTGKSLNFDGTDDYVTISSDLNNEFSQSNNITLEAQFYMEVGDTTFANLIGEAEMGDNKITSVLYVADGLIKAGFFGYPDFTQMSYAMTFGQWNHAAFTYDGTYQRLYLNGVEVASQFTENGLPSGSEEWRIGRLWDTDLYFKGSIDEIRIWNIARTATEIQDHISTSFTGTETGLVAYYNFNQGTANGNNTSINKVTDKKGNYDGDMLNFAMTGTTSNFVGEAFVTNRLPGENAGKSEIFPNPFTSSFTISSPVEGVELKIFDSKGSIVYKQTLPETASVNLEKLPSGLYKLLFIKDGNPVEERTLMKAE